LEKVKKEMELDKLRRNSSENIIKKSTSGREGFWVVISASHGNTEEISVKDTLSESDEEQEDEAESSETKLKDGKKDK